MKFFKTNEEGKLRLTDEGNKKYNLFIKCTFMFFVVAQVILVLKEIILRLIF